MTEANDHSLAKEPAQPFPWKHVLITAFIVLALVGLIVLIRRGGGMALAAAAPAMALRMAQTHRRRSDSDDREQKPIDMEFLKAQLAHGARGKAVVTPTQLKNILNGLFEKRDLPTPFKSEQHMAKILSPLGLQSEVRSVPGRSERRWYDLAGYGAYEAHKQ